ncbi:MAG: N-glycosylase/DNA lyase [Infirmifilum sp.]
MFFPNEEKARQVGLTLREPRLADEFVRADPQYHSVEKILGKMGFIEGTLYIVGIALVSYMLTTRGEDHWSLTAKYAQGSSFEALRRFVMESPSLARFRDQKARRIETYVSKVSPHLRELLEKNTISLDEVHRLIAENIEGRIDDKTVVFAVKMLYYSLLASKKIFTGGEKIPIPVDYRVSLVTFTSGMLQGWRCNDNLREFARIARSTYRPVIIKLWGIVSDVAGIPSLKLDSIAWVSGLCIDENLEQPGRVEECLLRRYNIESSLIGHARVLWGELINCSH